MRHHCTSACNLAHFVRNLYKKIGMHTLTWDVLLIGGSCCMAKGLGWSSAVICADNAHTVRRLSGCSCNETKCQMIHIYMDLNQNVCKPASKGTKNVPGYVFPSSPSLGLPRKVLCASLFIITRRMLCVSTKVWLFLSCRVCKPGTLCPRHNCIYMKSLQQNS